MDNFEAPTLFGDVICTENEKLALCLEVANHNLVRYDSADAFSGQRRWYFECTQAIRGDIALYQEE